LPYQAAQLAHVLDGRLKELAEDANREKSHKDVAKITTKEKTKVAATTEKKASASEKARAAVEKRSFELKVKLGETKLKLAEAVSMTTAQAEELADPKTTLKAYKNNWYNEGFANAENSAKPIIQEARKLAFEGGWLAALQALRVPEDSFLKDLGQIPFPSSAPAVQNPL